MVLEGRRVDREELMSPGKERVKGKREGGGEDRGNKDRGNKDRRNKGGGLDN